MMTVRHPDRVKLEDLDDAMRRRLAAAAPFARQAQLEIASLDPERAIAAVERGVAAIRERQHGKLGDRRDAPLSELTFEGGLSIRPLNALQEHFGEEMTVSQAGRLTVAQLMEVPEWGERFTAELRAAIALYLSESA